MFIFDEHGKGTARLEEAVAAYRAASEELTRERAPLDWASAQFSLGRTLATLGRRTEGPKGVEYSEQAIVSWRNAQLIRNRSSSQFMATIQNSIGYTLVLIGERENDLARFD